MPKVNITIDGQPVQAEAGSTILDAATAAGISIPTLCHHPALKPVGNCRMCLVEIERQRTLQAACVFPVSEGLVIHTNSPKVIEARRFVLELILSDHAFFCMYCEMSGDCELQSLAYKYGIDRVPYPYNYPWEPVDASRDYFIFDSKRCILCRRCVRACDELVANHTLGIAGRGFASKVIADLDVPFGQSSCISCGTCLQVCPTGALTDRRSAYMGRSAEVDRTKTTCLACSIGCAAEVVSRTGNILRVEGDWQGEVNQGLLCILGRFEQLEPPGERYLTPVVRRDGRLQATTWEDALDLAAKKINATPAAKIVGVAAPTLTNETLARFRDVLTKVDSQKIGTFYGTFPTPPTGASEGSLADIAESDLIVITGVDLTKTHQVAGAFVRRALGMGARLVIIGDDNGMADYAYETVKPAEAAKAVELASRSEKPVVIYGPDAAAMTMQALAPLADKARFIKLLPGSNTAGAYKLGFGDVTGTRAEVALVWAGDHHGEIPEALWQTLKDVDFVILQAAYQTPLSEIADVILPATIWPEKEGSTTNTEGRTLQVHRVLQTCEGIIPDETVLQMLADKVVARS